jgi:tripartite-type tricarboxylate transporter receptor subunit TctC
MSRLRFRVVPLTVAALIFTGAAYGQDYPNKPIRIVAPAAGGGTDFTARIVATGLSSAFNQQVIVDNRATTFVASEVAAKSAPDGYTLHANGTSLWTNPILRKMPYDAIKDFTSVSQLVREVTVLAVHPSLPVKTIKELIALAKARPGELNYAATTPGAPAHLATELFKSMAGVNITHVPYKATAPSVVAVISGESQMTITDSGTLAPHIKAGRLRGLAVTTAQPSPLVPGLPTIAASGVPGYEAVNITGLWAPSGTPAAIIARLNQEVVRHLNTPEVKTRFFNAGVDVVGSTAAELDALVRSENTKMIRVIKEARIPTE